MKGGAQVKLRLYLTKTLNLTAPGKTWYRYPAYKDLTWKRLEYFIAQIYPLETLVIGIQITPSMVLYI